MQIKVAIVDDDEGIRNGLATLIRRAPSCELTGEYSDAETALKEIPRNPPDLVLMDINLPGLKGPGMRPPTEGQTAQGAISDAHGL